MSSILRFTPFPGTSLAYVIFNWASVIGYIVRYESEPEDEIRIATDTCAEKSLMKEILLSFLCTLM